MLARKFNHKCDGIIEDAEDPLPKMQGYRKRSILQKIALLCVYQSEECGWKTCYIKTNAYEALGHPNTTSRVQNVRPHLILNCLKNQVPVGFTQNTWKELYTNEHLEFFVVYNLHMGSRYSTRMWRTNCRITNISLLRWARYQYCAFLFSTRKCKVLISVQNYKKQLTDILQQLMFMNTDLRIQRKTNA